jgi:hypothetical protein
MQNLVGKHGGRRTPAIFRMMWEGSINIVYRVGVGSGAAARSDIIEGVAKRII